MENNFNKFEQAILKVVEQAIGYAIDDDIHFRDYLQVDVQTLECTSFNSDIYPRRDDCEYIQILDLVTFVDLHYEPDMTKIKSFANKFDYRMFYDFKEMEDEVTLQSHERQDIPFIKTFYELEQIFRLNAGNVAFNIKPDIRLSSCRIRYFVEPRKFLYTNADRVFIIHNRFYVITTNSKLRKYAKNEVREQFRRETEFALRLDNGEFIIPANFAGISTGYLYNSKGGYSDENRIYTGDIISLSYYTDFDNVIEGTDWHRAKPKEKWFGYKECTSGDFTTVVVANRFPEVTPNRTFGGAADQTCLYISMCQYIEKLGTTFVDVERVKQFDIERCGYAWSQYTGIPQKVLKKGKRAPLFKRKMWRKRFDALLSKYPSEDDVLDIIRHSDEDSVELKQLYDALNSYPDEFEQHYPYVTERLYMNIR